MQRLVSTSGVEILASDEAAAALIAGGFQPLSDKPTKKEQQPKPEPKAASKKGK